MNLLDRRINRCISLIFPIRFVDDHSIEFYNVLQTISVILLPMKIIEDLLQ